MRTVQSLFYLVVFLLTLGVSACGGEGKRQERQAVQPVTQNHHVSTEAGAGSDPLTVTPEAGPVNALTPLRLTIKSIGVDASVEPVGILANGDMATPEKDPWNNVGWYSVGPYPGEKGSAVIAGHP
ncbi:MAG: class F sortase [Ktedonobacteraceae bacterium]|nr:class F sortase [Ktedonobacteraceae bacterium]